MYRTITTIFSAFMLLATASFAVAADDEQPLPPEVAFAASAQVRDANSITIRFNIADAYYLYHDKISVKTDAADTTLGVLEIPDGKIKEDEFFGTVETHRGELTAILPLLQRPAEATVLKLNIKSQGCADLGLCYPPNVQEVSVELPAQQAGGVVQAVAVEAVAGAVNGTTLVANSADVSTTSIAAPVSVQDRLTGELSSNSIGLVLLGFFGMGLLLALTPCVFPMIPILSGIIVGQGEALTTRKALTLSAVYVLAMALTYTIVGVLVGLSGENIQIWFQTPWVIYLFAAMFVALSFSMFGFYELQMPGAIQSKLTSISNRQSGGDYLGVAIMGLLSALIVGPCVTAPLMAVLVYIAESGDAVKGGLVLFSLSLGMGAPLMLVGASAGKLLPRAGGWMDAVKAVFGVLMIAMAIWMLERVLPESVILMLTAMLLIVSSVYMGALGGPALKTGGWYQLWRGLGLVFLIYGAVLLIGAASGGKSLLTPLAGLNRPVTAGGNLVSNELHFSMVNSSAELDAAIAQASASGQPVMFDFYADWCASCKEMEAFTFTDVQVQSALSEFTVLQVDVTDNNEEHQALLKRFGLFGPPAILFFDRNGQEQRNLRVIGFMGPEPFATNVRSVL